MTRAEYIKLAPHYYALAIAVFFQSRAFDELSYKSAIQNFYYSEEENQDGSTTVYERLYRPSLFETGVDLLVDLGLIIKSKMLLGQRYLKLLMVFTTNGGS